jgi:hypothetical protein
MPKQDPAQQSRRRLIKTLTGTGGLILGAKALPEQWTKPVVDAVLLPAHAQATGPSLSISCTAFPGFPPEGTPIPVGTVVAVTFQLTPNPGAVGPVLIEFLCDATVVAFGDFFTDATGTTPGIQVTASCAPGENAIFRATFSGVSGQCSWPVIAIPSGVAAPNAAPSGNGISIIQ